MANNIRTSFFDRLQSGVSEGGKHSLPASWARDAEEELLLALWNGWHEAHREKFAQACGIKKTDLHKEPTISTILFPYIKRQLAEKGSSFYLMPEPPEFESTKSPRAQPPAPDFAFKMTGDFRLNWPVEAKVIEKPKSVEKYCDEVRDNFMTARYGRYANTGALLGYLLTGGSNETFDCIQEELKTVLQLDDRFKEHAHRYSIHTRTFENKTDTIHCHHLLFLIGEGNIHEG